MVASNLRFGLTMVCLFVGFTSMFADSPEEHSTIQEDDWWCIFSYPSEVLICMWPPTHSDVDVLYQVTEKCYLDVVHTFTCETGPPCSLPVNAIRPVLCDYYNVTLRENYTTSEGSFSLVLPWKTFNLNSISKYPPLTVKIKDVDKSCITLEWTQGIMRYGSDIIRFQYTSEWEPSKVETVNMTVTGFSLGMSRLPSREKELCGLTPSTQYTISVTIRPSESHVWSENFTIVENTTDSVPARSPLTISSAFMKIPNNATIILYWKLLSAEEWQSSLVEGTYELSVQNKSSEPCQQVISLKWSVSQTEVSLCKNQETFIKLQANNSNGYAENYTDIIIPYKGPPAPSDVTAVINEPKKEVRYSWDSEFHEQVVLFWCLWGTEYQCLKDSLHWKVLMDVSNNSATLLVEDLEPSSAYMFGVAVSHLDMSSGMTWTRCLDERGVYKSNCNTSESLTPEDRTGID